MEFKFTTVYEERDGVFVATCIEMGLVATADSKEDLPGTMEKLISRQLSFALENENLEDIYHPADHAWVYLRDLMAKKKARQVRKSQSEQHVDGTIFNVTNTAYAIAC